MKWRLLLILLMASLLFAPLVACGSTQRLAVPLTERLAPAGLFRLPALKDEKFIILTIDDSPSSRTRELVALLEKYDAKATFFVHTGQITDKNLDALQMAVTAGHELGNHLPKDAPAWKMGREEFETAFLESHQDLQKYGDGARRYFRPPHGFYRPRHMDQVMKEAGYDSPLSPVVSDRRYILASFIPWDAGGDTTNTDDPELNARRARRYANQLVSNLYPGAIVVFHDGESGGREARLTATFISLEAFLSGAQKKGYDIISLSEGISRIQDKKSQRH